MGKYDDTLAKIRDFFDGLTGEAKSKCALCNETLTHIVKMAEVETGAGTATVTKVLAEQINDVAVEGDRVSEHTLRDRVRRHSGQKDESGRFAQKSQNQDAPTVKPVATCSIPEQVLEKVTQGKTVSQASREVAEVTGKDPEVVRNAYNREKERVGDPARASQAMNIVGYAIAQLERLSKNDPKCEDAILKLETWIQKFKEQK